MTRHLKTTVEEEVALDRLECITRAENMAKWNDANSTPRERGWYLRDYRDSGCKDCPPFSVDLFEPVPDRNSILYPGCWYVHDDQHGLNDAHYAFLPWKRIKA